jgi:hypothetical protein
VSCAFFRAPLYQYPILEADLDSCFVEPKLETYNINPDLITEKSTQNQSRSCGSSLRTIGRNGCDT